MWLVYLFVCALALLGGGAAAVVLDSFQLNHIQVKGTHNSYHLLSDPTIPVFDYQHAPLAEQIRDFGARQIELDIHPPNAQGEFPVYHENVYDVRSRCSTLTACLHAAVGTFTSSILFVHVEAKSDLNASQWDAFDSVLRSAVGADRLVTPDTVSPLSNVVPRRSDCPVHTSCETGWPYIADLPGYVMVTLDRPYPTYLLSNLAGRVAFPMFPFNERSNPLALVLKMNDPVTQFADIQRAAEIGYLVRTRADADFPFRQWSNQSILQGYFDLLDTDDSHSVSLTEVQTFLSMFGVPLPPGSLSSVMTACGGHNQSISQFNCTVSAARAYGLVAMPYANDLPTLNSTIMQRDFALRSGAHIVSTDYPVSQPLSAWPSYFVDMGLSNSKPFGCNPVTTQLNASAGRPGAAVCTQLLVNSEATGRQVAPEDQPSGSDDALTGGEIAAIVVVLLMVVALIVVLVRAARDGRLFSMQRLEEEEEDDEEVTGRRAGPPARTDTQHAPAGAATLDQLQIEEDDDAHVQLAPFELPASVTGALRESPNQEQGLAD